MIKVLDAPANALEYSRFSDEELRERIEERKRALNAVILGHNYQRVEIQAVSDYLGDSLGLSQEAAGTDADVIVFCGVHFMAETAKILSPQKTVLMPDLRAGCPMADFVTGDSLRRLKSQFPDAPVISYVNSTAEVKAESEICCTSSNAVEVVRSFAPNRTLLFVPDRNLARYAAEKTDRPYVTTSQVSAPEDIEAGSVVAWDGYCYVHDDFVLDELAEAKKKYPEAKVVIHPEARRELLEKADFVSSTSRMVQIAESHDQLIIGTERGLVDQLKQRFPNKILIPLSGAAICGNMKMNTLAKLAWSLDHLKYEVLIEEEIRSKAELSLRRMLEVSGGWRASTAEEEALETAGMKPNSCGCA